MSISAVNLLFAINQKFTDLLCSCLRSVARNGGAAHYSACILHSDLEAEDRARICREAGASADCRFIFVDESLSRGFPETERYVLGSSKT